MVRIQKGRAWRLLFAVILSSIFAAYCVFWRHTFVKMPDTGEGAAPETCGTCKDLASVLFDQTEDVQGDDGGHSEPYQSDSRPSSGMKGTMARSRRSHPSQDGALYGPYALAVQKGLKGVIQTDSKSRGLARFKLVRDLELADLGDGFPSLPPTYGYITSGFGWRRSPFHGGIVQHRGIDFSVPYGADIFATADGEVVFAGWFGGLGRTVAIEHSQGIVTRYAHASQLLVAEGDSVHRGDVIAQAGNSGQSTGTHLHYEVWIRGKAADPMEFLAAGEPGAFVAGENTEQSTRHQAGGLGLAMGGDAIEIKGVAPDSIPRYQSKALFRSNLAILAALLLVAGCLIARLARNDWIRMGWENSGT